MSDAEAWRAELQAHRRRLAILKEQAAIQRLSRDPRLDIEIAAIERHVADLQRKLGQIPDTSLTSAEPSAAGAPPPIAAGRDAIVANISGSSKAAVGKQISQIDQARRHGVRVSSARSTRAPVKNPRRHAKTRE